MNNIVKNVLIFAAGSAVGAFIAREIIKKDVENWAAELEEETKQIREKKSNRMGSRPSYESYEFLKQDLNCKGGSPDPDEIVLLNNKQEYKRIARDYNKVDLATLGKPGIDDYDGNAELVQLKPYVISIEDYSENRADFDKTTIYYYAEDDTLTDEDEEVITDISGIVGDDALNSFGVDSQSDNVVYVRNENLSIDYEIISLPESYSASVLGITPEPSKRLVRKHENNKELED